jgi:hypothetical protein
MRHVSRARLLLLAVLLSALLAGCGQTTVEIGLKETQQPGHWQASYLTFSGTKTDTVEGSAGKTLVLNYHAVVEKGTLEIRVENASKNVLWEASIQEDVDETVQLLMYQDGRYDIIVHGLDTGGSFDLTWQLQ